MMTIKEASRLAGVSIRTLQYYDKIGLLHPTGYTESGYRLYDDAALETLQQILLFRELEFPLKEIKEIISRPDFDKNKALEQQITLLTMKKERLEKLIAFARGIKFTGVSTMDFSVFDTKQIDEYARQAREMWGGTPEYREFEANAEKRTKDAEQEIIQNFMQLFAEFSEMKGRSPEAPEVQEQVKKLKEYISEYFYQCSDEILSSLGEMYAGDGEFMANIDKAGGEGTAQFAAEAIKVYCGK